MRVRVGQQVRQWWGVPQGLTFFLHRAGHHLPDRSSELDVARVLEDLGVTVWGQNDLLEIWASH